VNADGQLARNTRGVLSAASPAAGASASEPPLLLLLAIAPESGAFPVSAVDPLTGRRLWSSTWACGDPAYVCPNALWVTALWAGRRVLAVGATASGVSVGLHGWANASSSALYWLVPNFPAETGIGALGTAVWGDAAAPQADYPLLLAQVLHGDNSACHDTSQPAAQAQVITVAAADAFGVTVRLPLSQCPLPPPSACTAQSVAHARPVSPPRDVR
jgi:hypothetical protein